MTTGEGGVETYWEVRETKLGLEVSVNTVFMLLRVDCNEITFDE